MTVCLTLARQRAETIISANPACIANISHVSLHALSGQWRHVHGLSGSGPASDCQCLLVIVSGC